MKKDKTVALIGAGIAGIATSIRLQLKGYQVSVFEASKKAGGKLNEFEHEGFRFDMGPSLFTLPELVEDLFKLAGESMDKHLTYQKLDVITKYFWEDGTKLNAYADAQKFKAEVAHELGEKQEDISKFLASNHERYDLIAGLFMERSLHKLSSFTDKKALKGFLNAHKVDAFRTMHKANASTFKNPKTVQLFDRYATYNGSNPYEAPATLNLISHLEHNMGAYFPDKGMYQIVRALVGLAQRLGVKFFYKKRVERILLNTKANAVEGILVDGEKLSFSRVVSNMDITPTYRKLLPEARHPEQLLKQPKSSAGLIFYWNIAGDFPELDLHNVFFSETYEKEFEAIFKKKTLWDDPTVYLCLSKRTCPNDAPEGHGNWFVMINTPPDTGQDWEALREKAREAVLKKLSRQLGTDIGSKILHEEVLDPPTIESRTSSLGGSLYGNSSNNRWAAFMRHPNFSSRYSGLYFCGGSVHPGGGIPLCLLSAKITASLFH